MLVNRLVYVRLLKGATSPLYVVTRSHKPPSKPKSLPASSKFQMAFSRPPDDLELGNPGLGFRVKVRALRGLGHHTITGLVCWGLERNTKPL